MRAYGAAAVALLALTGCTTESGPSTGTGARTTVEPSSTSTTTAPPQPAPQEPGHNDEDADLAPPQAAPTWDAAARATALAVGSQVMEAFARPRLAEAAWWRGLRPLLTPAATVAYQGTDPANVPASRVTGRPLLAEVSSAYLARVAVPTDAGTYTVLLSRAADGAPWRAERITPPPGARP